MKKLLLLLLLILIGCSKEPINIDEVLIERNDGYYTKDTNQPYSGPVFSLHENGQLEMEVNLKNGKPDGLWKSYHKNGQLRREGTFKDGERDGFWKLYYNGQLEEEVTYKNGIENGPWKYYYENGQLEFEGTIKDGKENGPYKYYHENGQIEEEGTYKDGEEELVVEFFYKELDGVDGKKVNGRWDGPIKNYIYFINIEGSSIGPLLGSEGTYKDGVPDGPWKYYNENGQLEEERTYKDGELIDSKKY